MKICMLTFFVMNFIVFQQLFGVSRTYGLNESDVVIYNVEGQEKSLKVEDNLRLKTNIPFWGILMMNMGAEYRLSDKFSFDASIYYCPFRFSRTFNLKSFVFQPSLRYWFNSGMKGHFAGVHLAGAIYNVSFDDDFRYQVKNYPLMVAGLDYGYLFDINRHLGIELNIGVGYLHTRYDKFYNVDNGRCISGGVYNGICVTRLETSLVYKF